MARKNSTTTVPPAPEAGETSKVVAEGHASTGGLCLLVSTSSGVHVVPLGSGTVVLGRAENADVHVDDDSVSRHHARLVIDRRRVTITDLSSRNGTRIDGLRLEPGDIAEVQIGYPFELGLTTVVLQHAEGFIRGGRPPIRPRESTSPARQLEDGPIVHDPAMKRLYALLEVIGPTDLSVLVLGETGVGKEVFAHTLHARSERAARPFLQLNCGAVAQTLLESELFGHEKGAFTGADKAKEGFFEAANGGTLFLDEVGELSPAMQASLLRALSTGEITRVGGTRALRVDVRIIAATNRDLRSFIVEGRFRADLYFRLNGIRVKLPPLRKRQADILPLAKAFVARAAARQKKKAPTLSKEAGEALLRYSWPGNVRELVNAVERAVATSKTGVLEPLHLRLEGDDSDAVRFDEGGASRATLAIPSRAMWTLPPKDAPPAPEEARIPGQRDGPGRLPVKLYAKLEDITRDAVLEALAQSAGNQNEAAKRLGISRRSLIYRIEQYGIARPRKK
jgi:two-component system response regulator AtoC